LSSAPGNVVKILPFIFSHFLLYSSASQAIRRCRIARLRVRFLQIIRKQTVYTVKINFIQVFM
jgi:hypothetical protein